MAKRILYSSIILLYILNSITWIAIPEEKILNLSMLGCTLALTFLMAVFDYEKIKLYFFSSQFSLFFNTFFRAFLVFSILGLINYLAFKHPVSIDLSQFKLSTLSEQTIKVLKNVPGKITIKVFARKSEGEAILKLLELYRLEKKDIETEFVDIDLRPDLVKENEISLSNTLLLKYGERSYKIIASNELSITNGIIRVTRLQDPTIYYSIGHQEGNLEQKDNDGFSSLSELLNKALYKVVPVNLAQLAEVPAEVKYLMIWGPKTTFFDSEIKILDEYLKRGGSLIVGLDPNFKKDQLSSLRDLLRNHGINISNDLVVDAVNHFEGSNGAIPIIKEFNSNHPVTANFKGPIFLPLSSSISQTKQGKFLELAKTSAFPASWAESSLKEIESQKLTFTSNEDIKGPVTVVAVFEDKGKILAFGNANFVVNGYGKFGQNFLFLLNGINWSVDEGRLISLNNGLIKNDPIFIGAPQLGVIFYFSIIFAPLVLFTMAIYFFRRRLIL